MSKTFIRPVVFKLCYSNLSILTFFTQYPISLNVKKNSISVQLFGLTLIGTSSRDLHIPVWKPSPLTVLNPGHSFYMPLKKKKKKKRMSYCLLFLFYSYICTCIEYIIVTNGESLTKLF